VGSLHAGGEGEKRIAVWIELERSPSALQLEILKPTAVSKLPEPSPRPPRDLTENQFAQEGTSTRVPGQKT